MIRHFVFVKFRSDVSENDKQSIYGKLDGLREFIPGILDASFGPNISPEGMSHGFGDGFTMDFKDLATRDVYLEDPNHRAVGKELVGLAEGGRAGLLVFDLTV